MIVHEEAVAGACHGQVTCPCAPRSYLGWLLCVCSSGDAVCKAHGASATCSVAYFTIHDPPTPMADRCSPCTNTIAQADMHPITARLISHPYTCTAQSCMAHKCGCLAALQHVPLASRPAQYVVPPDFDPSVLSAVDLTSRATAIKTLPAQFFQRWTQLRSQVASQNAGTNKLEYSQFAISIQAFTLMQYVLDAAAEFEVQSHRSTWILADQSSFCAWSSEHAVQAATCTLQCMLVVLSGMRMHCAPAPAHAIGPAGCTMQKEFWYACRLLRWEWGMI